MAAEVIATAGHKVTIYDRMPTVGRKFLMAGRGGLNLTHSEPLDQFITRYGAASSWLAPAIKKFPPNALREWSHGLDQPTFIGTSGRVFPKMLKASPLLRAWLRRLDGLGIRFVLNRKWLGWDGQKLVFSAADQQREHIQADATLLALGGASWPRLGSDGGWVDILAQQGIAVAPLSPANCGFLVSWSNIFRERFQGHPLKPVTVTFAETALQGEAMITAQGIEGSVIYALSSRLRDAITNEGSAILSMDLRPGLSHGDLTTRLQSSPGSKSFSNYLRKAAGLSPVAIGLLYETQSAQKLKTVSADELATLIKACPLRLIAPAGMARAISTAGGIRRDDLDDNFMLLQKPGLFVAGEMLDWEAPTGGYLLQATLSIAVAAANGILAWLK
jgi:uncharacterized flavoprotein (TIGR03862 family)